MKLLSESSKLPTEVLQVLKIVDLEFYFRTRAHNSTKSQFQSITTKKGINTSRKALLIYCFLREVHFNVNLDEGTAPQQLSDQELIAEIFKLLDNPKALQWMKKTYENVFE